MHVLYYLVGAPLSPLKEISLPLIHLSPCSLLIDHGFLGLQCIQLSKPVSSVLKIRMQICTQKYSRENDPVCNVIMPE